jgi:GNAT superfamily N-acetyltransferase
VRPGRIDATWAAFFGLSPLALMRPGIHVVAHHELADYQGAWLFRHQAALCLSVQPELVSETRAVAAGRTLEDLFGETGIWALWKSRVQQIIGPAYQGYVESTAQLRHAPHPRVRPLGESDRTALQQLADACEVEAWEHAAIALDEPHAFGCFADARLMAVARYRFGWEETAHIGVVTHPACRGQGYGRAVVGAATAEALAEGRIVLYQTLLANVPSVALATGLGFEQYATHLAVRLAPTDPAA